MSFKQSKRSFIKQIIKITGVTFGLLTFGKLLSSPRKIVTNLPQINRKNKSENEAPKILITYESQFGSTAEIAKFIGKNLDAKGKEIDVLKMKNVTNLSQYSQVIIGSAIQYDKWMTEAREFIQINEIELATKSVSFFLVCLVLSKKDEKAKEKANGYATKTKALAPKIAVKNFGQFAGVLDYKKMSIGHRILAKGIFAILGIKEGDYRDWNAIRKWTKELS